MLKNTSDAQHYGGRIEAGHHPVETLAIIPRSVEDIPTTGEKARMSDSGRVTFDRALKLQK